jgi:hypothetical protein
VTHDTIGAEDSRNFLDVSSRPNLWEKAHKDFLQKNQLGLVQVVLDVGQLTKEVRLYVRSNTCCHGGLDFLEPGIIILLHLLPHHRYQAGEIHLSHIYISHRVQEHPHPQTDLSCRHGGISYIQSSINIRCKNCKTVGALNPW